MTYHLKDRSFSEEYIQKQHKAMRYLASVGLTSREIREFSIGRIDEDTREIVIKRKVRTAKYYDGIGRVFVDEFEKDARFPILGSGCEDFFLKDKFISCYLFTKEKPRSWRREVAKSSLYSLSVIEKICAKKPAAGVNLPLSFLCECGRIKVLNNAI